MDNLASTHAAFNNSNLQYCRNAIIDNICNCMTDRVAANHAAIQLVNETWNKSLTELICHLHPLDTVASSCRAALHKLETAKGKVFGGDCLAGNVVMQMKKLRYKDGKGDPRGFNDFLDTEHLPMGLIPRYRGNRLHIYAVPHLWKICRALPSIPAVSADRNSVMRWFARGTVG